ncbi:hypothetical protein PGT21_018756 [Puccinia graminis f. sp. tritici]|uniref:FHA domain-containing protein n=1 Tax=Puccinia graminis f. sp. tritici TaxID=56615 RepID=A0A5B0S1L1_PUCGR|nr:hypothetical protein PGT21_018756 [Puccinia graminis f. sp. tritici]KAA1131930.1 hypothetical protein PGTUg99_033958 [Puccinia graminis f. sp. tritici]
MFQVFGSSQLNFRFRNRAQHTTSTHFEELHTLDQEIRKTEQNKAGRMSSRYEKAYDRDRPDRETGSSVRSQGRSSKWNAEDTAKPPRRPRNDRDPTRQEEPRRYRSRSRSPNYPSRRRSRSPIASQDNSRPQQYHRQRSRSRSPTQSNLISKTAQDRRNLVSQEDPSSNIATTSTSEQRSKNQQLDLKSKSKILEDEEEEELSEQKDEPNFNPSGKLAAETKTFKGVVLKYHEPPEARKPTNKNWRLYVFKGKEQLDLFHIHRQSAYLFGRDRIVVDIPLDHPSSSKQHAVIQFRQICSTNEFGDSKNAVKPFIIDLESANGTFVNGTKIPTSRYYELQSGDVIKFGCSTREFVLIPET